MSLAFFPSGVSMRIQVWILGCWVWRPIVSGLNAGVRGTVTWGNKLLMSLCWYGGGLKVAGLGDVIVSECGAMGAMPRKKGRSFATMVSSRRGSPVLQRQRDQWNTVPGGCGMVL